MQARSWFAFIAILSIAFVAGSFANTQQATESDSLNELLKKRRDTLVELVSVLEKKHMEGTLMLNPLVDARNQLLDAELQLVETKEERLALFRKRIDNMRELEDSERQRYESGVDTFESFLSAKTARLQAEIDLAEEQQ